MGKSSVGAPVTGVTEAVVKFGDQAVEEMARTGRPDGAAALRKGGLIDRRPAEVAEEVLQLHGGGLAHQLQDEGYGAAKDQRAAADEVTMRLIDVLRASYLDEIQKSAQLCLIAIEGVGDSLKIGSNLMS